MGIQVCGTARVEFCVKVPAMKDSPLFADKMYDLALVEDFR